MNLKITPSTVSGVISVPASKSHTIRAVVVALLADGTSVLQNPLLSEDAESALSCAKKMGAETECTEDAWIIKGTGGCFNRVGEGIELNVGNSGTSLRLLSAVSALGNIPCTFDGDSSVRTRLMEPLLQSLQDLGAKIQSNNKKCPLTITGPLCGGTTTVNGLSSQFLSALLFTCPLSTGNSIINVINLHEAPYVLMTLDWLERQNIIIKRDGLARFEIPGGQKYIPFTRQIPADFSTAAFPLCAAAVTSGTLTITGLDFSDTQGDKEIFTHMEHMGVRCLRSANGVTVSGGRLRGIDIDCNAIPDALPALAAAACYAEGTTRLLNVRQARFKECDRISAMCAELNKMGGDAHELDDGLIINGKPLRGAELKSYGDHRIVMALAVAALGAEGPSVISGAEAAGVTYPGFIQDMRAVGAGFSQV